MTKKHANYKINDTCYIGVPIKAYQLDGTETVSYDTDDKTRPQSSCKTAPLRPCTPPDSGKPHTDNPT